MREEVLELLENEKKSINLTEINDKLGYTSIEDLTELQKVLNELASESMVSVNKKSEYILSWKTQKFRKGRISVNKNGYAFLILKDEDDIYIHKDDVNNALDSDIVLVRITDFTENRREGKVVKVLKRDINNIVGIIKSDGTNLYFEKQDKRDVSLIVDEESLNKCVEGEIVVATILSSLGNNQYTAEITKHVCHKDDPRADILKIAANYEIFPEFPKEVMDQTDLVPDEVREEDMKGRVDLTDKVIFTIDGVDTKDIDDAIGLEMKDGYYILRVSIADVSYYVEAGSPLDTEALTRGTSSYLADSVIPMLPHKLSNGICSLNPNVLRCAMTCEMKIDSRGKVVDSSIYPSIIKSVKKMNYGSVNRILMENKIDEGYEEYATILKQMQELAHIIRADRTRRGASNFDVPEAKIIVNDDGTVKDIERRKQFEGEKLIEDFMVIANETVATTLFYMNVPSIYRVHATPLPEKVSKFIEFCNSTGHKITGKYDNINPSSFQKLLEQIKTDEETAEIYRALAVRSMPKAYYSEENIGHFGLASKCYTHFTSPIRRYPDLQVHRLLREFLVNSKFDERTVNYWETNLPSIAERSSTREQAATNAEREVVKIKMAEYMENHIGEEYDAIISGVGNKGIFVQLSNLVEGLVDISTIEGDFFNYVEDRQMLIGKNTKRIFRFGDKLRVRCTGANHELGFIDFELIETLKKDKDEVQLNLKQDGKHHDRDKK